MDINPKDLRINAWSSKRPSAWLLTPPKGIQLIHLPTGICIEVESERSQHRNRTLALEKLQAELDSRS